MVSGSPHFGSVGIARAAASPLDSARLGGNPLRYLSMSSRAVRGVVGVIACSCPTGTAERVGGDIMFPRAPAVVVF